MTHRTLLALVLQLESLRESFGGKQASFVIVDELTPSATTLVIDKPYIQQPVETRQSRVERLRGSRW